MLGQTPDRRSGFTLVEMTIAGTIAVIILVSAIGILGSTTTDFGALAPIDEIQELGRVAVDRVAEDLRACQSSSLVFISSYPPSGPASDVQVLEAISYTAGPGSSAGTTTWKTLEFRLETSPIDANADGNKTDDFRLVRIDNGVSTTLCHHVQKGGFTITQAGNNLLIQLTMITATGNKEVVTRTLTTSASLRN